MLDNVLCIYWVPPGKCDFVLLNSSVCVRMSLEETKSELFSLETFL